MPLGMEIGLSPGDWQMGTQPLLKKRDQSPLPNFKG